MHTIVERPAIPLTTAGDHEEDGSPPPSNPLQERYSILLVDDDDNYSALVKDVLGFAENFSLERAANLRGMWSLLEQNTYSALLLDYSFPDGTGLDALRKLVESQLSFPIIIVTGRGDERIAAQAIQLGATDYFVKCPETVFELPVLISKAVRNHAYKVENRKSLEKIRYQALLLDNVRDAVVVWDDAGTITYWNPAAEELYGRRASDQVGRFVAEVYFSIFDPCLDPNGASWIFPGEMERAVRTGRGEPLWIVSRVVPLHDESAGGHSLGYMDVTRDITARKKAEDQIRDAQASLLESARLTAIGELASGVAHQINNPLTAIIAEAQMLVRELPPGAPGRESAVIIEQAGWKGQQAVQDLLEFSRATPDTLQSVSVNETIEKAVRMVGAPIQSAGGGLEMELAEGLPPVRGYPMRLEDVWVNLLLLARDAEMDGKPHRILIRSKVYGTQAVVVEVGDDGTPIPPEVQDSLFEPHFTGAVAGRGNGMEYSICREIVRQHGGQIRATSTPDFGTIIEVTLPAEDGHGTGEYSRD
jgi:PAS domain S-box-containing protein